jgi:tetratricopeptide (TPR) repeat protein
MNDQHGVGDAGDVTVSIPDGAPQAPQAPRPARSPAAAALLNLTGLVLGYAYLRAWWRFGPYLAGAVALVVVALLTQAAETPWAWQALAGIWLGWTALDAWLLARRGPRLRGPRQLVPVGIAVVLVAAVVAGYMTYTWAGGRAYDAGVAAQSRGDCDQASAEFALVTGVYELTFSPDIRAADVRLEQCDEFTTAAEERRTGAFDDAVARYRAFRQQYPRTELVPFVTRELLATFGQWADARRAAGDLSAAIEVYRDALTEPDAPAAFREKLAATSLDRAVAARTGMPAVGAVQAASQDLLTIAREFGDAPAAAQVHQAFADTYVAATPAVAEQRWCDALPVLDYLVTLPDPETGGIPGRAGVDRARSLFECGLANYRSGDTDGSLARLDQFLRDYPNDPGQAQARSAVVAATIAQAKGVPPPPLPGPLAGDSPGSIPYQFFNLSPYEVRLLVNGPTTHEVVIPPCPQCPASYPIDLDQSCPERFGKPSVTLRLRPGVYDDLAFAPSEPDIDESEVETTTLQPGYEYWGCYYVGP